MVRFLIELGHFTRFAGASIASLTSVFKHFQLFCVQLFQLLRAGLAMSAIGGFGLGLVVWMHLGKILAEFEGSSILPTVLMVAVVREFAPTLVGLIAATRLAAGMTSELAGMVVTEQVDGLVLSGVNLLKRLVVPRVLGTALALPLLTIVFNYLAFLGAALAESTGGTLTFELFAQRATDRLQMLSTLAATLKSIPFGFLVGLLACWFGLNANRDMDSIRNTTMGSVLWCSVSVIVLNVLLVGLMQLFNL